MQKRLANIFFSTKLTAFLFIAFAVAMATGTILDAGQDMSPTPYTRNLIYNTWWFEAIMVFFIINFTGNIFRFRLYKKEKWATFILHLSFILILVTILYTFQKYKTEYNKNHKNKSYTQTILLLEVNWTITT